MKESIQKFFYRKVHFIYLTISFLGCGLDSHSQLIKKLIGKEFDVLKVYKSPYNDQYDVNMYYLKSDFIDYLKNNKSLDEYPVFEKCSTCTFQNWQPINKVDEIDKYVESAFDFKIRSISKEDNESILSI